MAESDLPADLILPGKLPKSAVTIYKMYISTPYSRGLGWGGEGENGGRGWGIGGVEKFGGGRGKGGPFLIPIIKA